MPTCTFQPFTTAARSGKPLRASATRSSCGPTSPTGLGRSTSHLPRRHQFTPGPPPALQQPHRQHPAPWAPRTQQPLDVRVQSGGEPQQQPAPEGSGSSGSLGSVGLFVLWAGLVFYAFFLSTNQTPVRDEYILRSLVGLGTYQVNEVFKQLFFIMGIWPLIYTALLIPAGKSGNNVPAWPFVTLSYAFGAFGLLPYMALWTPPKDPPAVPPPKSQLEGVGNLLTKGMESPVTAAVLLLGSVATIYQAATAGPEAWAEYFKLFDESRFVHVTTVDFLTLSTLAPFWMYNDASLRKWGQKDSLLPVLSVIPLLGPAIYLCLRPKAQ